MLYFLISIIFCFTLKTAYCATECFDFQCSDSGSRKDNCFKCTNVSTIAREQWLSNLQGMIDISRHLKRFDHVLTLENKIKEGMFCCHLNAAVPKTEFCSISFNDMSVENIMHYGMSCIPMNMWHQIYCSNNVGYRCCRKNHCNSPNTTEQEYIREEMFVKYPDLKTNQNPLIISISVSLFIVIIIIIIIFYCLFKARKKAYIFKNYPPSADLVRRPFYRKLFCLNKFFSILRSFKRRSNGNLPSEKDDTGYGESLTDQLYRPYDVSNQNSLRQLSCSGSGSGMPLMTRRTAATDITLIQSVGEGRFGTVWLGKWNGDSVAVKIFSSRDEVSWAREKDMYQQNFLRHSNVLGFVTTDRRDNGLATELWLVTDFHENGSLFEYLRVHMVSVEQAVKMARSITNGLTYLHMEINGLDGKPGIAHRDLKSRNILVKSCGECCIGDLGLAVRLNEDCSSLDLNNVGTRRYMAPEIILDKIVQPDMIYNGGLEVFKKADIYSYSLVIWEILRRCECLSMKIVGSFYEMPYQNLVSNDPSIEEMKQVICDKKIRPPINPNWDNLNPLKDISKAVRESWFEEPASRLNIMRLKKIMSVAWNEINILKSQINEIAMCDNFLSNDSVLSDSSYHCKSPFSNATISTEFPSSLTSNDIIPNIVIKSKDAFSTDSYCLGNDESGVKLMHS